MNKTRKLMGLAAALAFAMVMLPASAFADTTQYDLFVNGEQFTSEKLTIECGEGTATYDPATHTLTLNNASIANTTGYGGIASKLTGDLTITLQGSNHITFDDNMGIMAAGNVEITGPGNLAINVAGETRDGLSVAGDVSVRATNLAVNAPGGVGIASDGTVSIDNAQVTSAALYAGIDAINLFIENGSVVDISAAEDSCNAAFVSPRDGATGGNIRISNSNVVAKSVFPGLFADNNLAISGASVQSTSTADSALWASGDLTIGGNAHVTLDGKYPSGCNGNFTVYAAEIDAKNTNDENIPALSDSPVIGGDYDLTYAVAVDGKHGSGKTADSNVRALRGVFNIGRSIGIGIYECGSRIWRIYTCSDLQSFWKCGKRISFSTKLCESKTIVCPLDCDWKWSVSCGEKGEPCEDKWSDSGENCGLRSERFAEHGSVYGAGGL